MSLAPKTDWERLEEIRDIGFCSIFKQKLRNFFEIFVKKKDFYFICTQIFEITLNNDMFQPYHVRVIGVIELLSSSILV